jgi:hypothetical protein
MKSDERNYYTAGQAQARLGVDKNRFNYLVRTGKIKKYVPPGMAQGRYSKAQIDRLARENLAFMAYDESQGVTFSKVINHTDIEDEYELAELMFGSSAIHDIPTREAWLAKNPETDFIVRDSGVLVAFLNLLPVKHDTIMDFMEGKIRGWDIPADDVLPYTPGETLECIVMGMGTDPRANRGNRARYGARLISGTLDFLEELARRGVTISNFYATSVTPTGIAILRNAGFEEMGKTSKDSGKRKRFVLDTMTSDTLLAQEYRNVLYSANEQTDEKLLKLKS